MPAIHLKITESVRVRALKRPLVPAVIKDVDLKGFALVVSQSRGFWCLYFQPRGRRPDGRRWGGGVRFEIGDAHEMPLTLARAEALAAKGKIKKGKDPHREAMAARANVEAARSILPTTTGAALDLHAEALATHTTPSPWTRSQSVRYARKAAKLMKAEALPLSAVDARMIRLMLVTMKDSQSEKVQVHGGFNRFSTWCRRQGLITVNPCDALDRGERPKPGPARANVPSVDELRQVWTSVETEPAAIHDATRLLLLTALRRDEVAGLLWNEVDFANRRLVISGVRMKNRQTHIVPLAPQAVALLQARMPAKPAPNAPVFPSAAGTVITSWGRVLVRIRKALGVSDLPRDRRLVLHDIRRTFASVLADYFDADAIDRALAHKRSGVAGVYNRSARMDARVAMMSKWADLLLDAGENDNVLPFARHSNG